MSGGSYDILSADVGENPGNANLPIGGIQDAIQENGVPRISAKLRVRGGFLLESVVRRAHQRA
jgi:hypothetical protein